MHKDYYVYLITNKYHSVIYTGMTNNLMRRMYEHKNKLIPGFSQQYNVHHLVYFEITSDVSVAIAREKQIKGWSRQKKIDLINTENPTWKDLYEELLDSSEIPRFARNDTACHSER